jgi:hypothetical protein
MHAEVNQLDATTAKLVTHNERHTENLALLHDILKKVQNTAVGVSQANLFAARDDVLLQVRGAIEPFIKSVAKTSASRDDPGGLLV